MHISECLRGWYISPTLLSIFTLLAATKRSTECKLDIREGFCEEAGRTEEKREGGLCSGFCMLVNSPDNMPSRDTRYSTMLQFIEFTRGAVDIAVSCPDFYMSNEGLLFADFYSETRVFLNLRIFPFFFAFFIRLMEKSCKTSFYCASRRTHNSSTSTTV